MNTRMLGNTGIEVSILGLGAAPLGNLFKDVPQAQAIDTIHASLDAGITFLDTAPKYGNGLSEKRLGMALKDVPRDSYILATKVGWDIHSGERPTPAFTREETVRGLAESLERLQLDRVDIVHIHDCDRFYEDALDNVYPVLDELRSQGAIKAVSVGVNYWETLMKFMQDADFDCFMMANQYSLLQQDGLGVLDECQQRKIGILLAGVMATGILATGAVPGAKFRYREAPPEIVERVQHLEDVCERHGVSLPSAALQFGLSHPAVSSLVIGASSPDRIGKNVAGIEAHIPNAFWQELRASGVIDEAAPLPG